MITRKTKYVKAVRFCTKREMSILYRYYVLHRWNGGVLLESSAVPGTRTIHIILSGPRADKQRKTKDKCIKYTKYYTRAQIKNTGIGR